MRFAKSSSYCECGLKEIAPLDEGVSASGGKAYNITVLDGS